MAYTTQYIGSRYVPLFAEPAEWNSARTYEPLTIVMHDGNSYTSRQYVPIGIKITNEKFWALTGNYNAQVEQYRRDVTSEIERAQSSERVLQANIDAEKTRAEGAEQTLQTNIDAEKTKDSCRGRRADVANEYRCGKDPRRERRENTRKQIYS